MDGLKILVKYPTRQRPHLFLKNLKEYSEKCYRPDLVQWVVSYDFDDKTMTNIVLDEARKYIPNIQLICGNSKSKIDAINRDMNVVADWDILLLVSDDMWVKVHGWDQEIRNQMSLGFPDLDGCLWFHDGSNQKRICTLSCIGRKYYNSLGNIYYPKYKSFFCDNEFTDRAIQENKMRFIDRVIISHEHYAWGGQAGFDALYDKNNIHWEHDEKLYNERKLKGFPND